MTTTPRGGDTTPADTTGGDTTPADTTGATAPAGTTGDTTGGTAAPAGGANAAQFGGGGGDGSIKIGFTAPLTGPLAGFGEANEFIMAGIETLVADGIMLGDKSYSVEFVVKDVQSNSDTAASQAGSLILEDGVDMMIAIATPEMINPVADQCEANGMPCLSTLAPWQPYFFGRGGDPAAGFDWTYHFFWGAEQLVAVFVDMWNSIETNKVVGLLCPNDPDGNALADPTTASPPVSRPAVSRSSTPAGSRPATPTSRASSASSRTRASRSCAASRSRPTSPRSGPRPSSRTSTPRSSRWPRRCCSRRPSRPSATAATVSRPRSGGPPPTPSPAR